MEQAVQGGVAAPGGLSTPTASACGHRPCCGLGAQNPGGDFGHHGPICGVGEGTKDSHRLMMGVPRMKEARILILGVHGPRYKLGLLIGEVDTGVGSLP